MTLPLTIPRLAAVTASCSALALVAAPSTARACGGFFCSNQPVIQTGESIIFAVDHANERVHAVIRINYSGSAPDFAWILPLVAAPETIDVATDEAFRAVDRVTAPSFQPTFEFSGGCSRFPSGGAADAGLSFDAGASPGGGVEVLAERAVGPYESVVLQGSDPDAVRGWLVDHQYLVTDAMMQTVVPYLEQGNVLLALRLQNDRSAGDVQPIALTMRSTEPCIPLRMTAIAAQEDMSITAIVLSNAGRAIPSNYLHVEPNWLRLNWVTFGSNYRTLVSLAADEAGGNAFVTEYSGATQRLRGALHFEGRYRLDEVTSQQTVADVLTQLQWQGLTARVELSAILRRHVPDALLVEHGLDPATFWSCPSCFWQQAQMIPFDATALVAEIEDRILRPDRAVQALFDGFATATRLYTRISPAEMSMDPVFSFRSDLPDVDNVRRATVRFECGSNGGISRGIVELDDGRRAAVDATGNPLGDVAEAPASDLIAQLETGDVFRDNRDRNRGLAETTPGRDAACGCTAADATSGAAGLAGLALFVLGLALVRRS
ncbi:DUF2330 domain-containing protein [Myxococcota bacterium]|nr:DUF2330 domain-containing protein [Myxococcota bacterium]